MYVKCVGEKVQHLFEVDAIEIDHAEHSRQVRDDAYYALSERTSNLIAKQGASVMLLYVLMKQPEDEVLLVTDADVYVMNGQGETIDKFSPRKRS